MGIDNSLSAEHAFCLFVAGEWQYQGAVLEKEGMIAIFSMGHDAFPGIAVTAEIYGAFFRGAARIGFDAGGNGHNGTKGGGIQGAAFDFE